MLHAIIMAGGAGTRFWPESRADRPKQLLPLAGERTMLQATFDRLAGAVAPERVLVVTNARLIEQVAAQLPELPADNIIGEPCKRDTAPCIGLAALHVARDDADATMVVMPSDHVISPAAAFRQAMLQAAALVDAEPSRLVTFGIRPSYAAESFGYIERGARLPAVSAAEPGPASYRVARFREKPPASVAREYVAAGKFYWNSGIFVWKAATIAAELAERQPRMMVHLERICAARGQADSRDVFEREFAAIRGISIDYAVMEHATGALVIEAPFEWDDVGSWQALARLRGVDAEGNTIVARHVGLSTSGSIVRGPADHLIVTLGVKDCLVVSTPDATLVANKHEEESLRKVVKLIEERGWHEFLERRLQPVKINQLIHVAIHVADVERSSRFYADVLKLEQLPRPAFTFPGAWFRLGADQELHLLGGRDAEVKSHSRGNHFALLVDDIEAWELYFKERQFSHPPRRIRPDGAYQIFVTDPDGHVVELCTPPGMAG